MRAAIYARYSSDQQRAASIEDQIRLCKERIALESWTLVQVYRDAAISGASTLRAGYQAMMEGARKAEFDVVVAEALDRLSRDQEDIAALFKRLQFAGIRLVTLAEGEIGVLHIGLKGTMNAPFLKDLADKTRRGLRGRIEAGKSGGGNAYGYDVVRGFGPKAEPARGNRTVNAAEAAIVRDVFTRYAAGVAPRKIAFDLNANRVPAPRGSAWSASTLNGNRARGTGVLNNEMYLGRLIWNRLTYAKDPETGKRRSRPNADDAVIAIEAPELAIVPRELWDAVKARQAGLDERTAAKKKKGPSADAPSPFWSKKRPRYLFSGLMRCRVCGGGFSKISEAHFGCSTARYKGETVCSNRLTIRRDALEATVMDGLRSRLMDPALFKVFAEEFASEWNRLQSQAGANLSRIRNERERVCRQIDRLVDALADGEPAARLTEKLKELERRRLELERKLETTTAPAPRLHPSIAEAYRRKVHELHAALKADDASPAREELIRSLVEAIVLVPEDGRLRVEVRGELATVLRLSGYANEKAPAVEPELLVEQIKMVAGAGFEPAAFRL
jgi:site-specific DNA recombinase